MCSSLSDTLYIYTCKYILYKQQSKYKTIHYIHEMCCWSYNIQK